MTSRRRRRPRIGYERRIFLLALLAALPGTATALALLWTGDHTPRLRWTFSLLLVGLALVAATALRERVIRPIQALSNLLAALREGDYSFRFRAASPDDSLGLALEETNALADTLREQRLGALEAAALLRTVMEEIDVAVFAFDGEDHVVLANRAAERLLGRNRRRIHGIGAQALGLDRFLDSEEDGRILDAVFPGGAGRWEARVTEFRQGGLPHRLLVLSDLSRALREEERQAWQRLVRVLGHEINNSLAPIKSIATSLRDTLRRNASRPADFDTDLARGLDVVSGRADALSRFMSSYARLARLPPPKPDDVDVGDHVRRVAELETRLPVRVEPGPDVHVRADADQLEQLLINLITNAVDASLETGGGVCVGWEAVDGRLEVWVRDEGPGVADTANLFVPFFTTKPTGSGIGLALCRQIAEAHGGAVSLANRPGGGCEAKLVLPSASARMTRTSGS